MGPLTVPWGPAAAVNEGALSVSRFSTKFAPVSAPCGPSCGKRLSAWLSLRREIFATRQRRGGGFAGRALVNRGGG